MRAPAAGLLLLLVAADPVAAADPKSKPRIDPLTVERVDGRLRVSFEVAHGLDPEQVERIRSGLPVEQRHRVELVARRTVPLWPSKVHRKIQIHTSAVYDTLTERYALTRRVRVGPRKKKEDTPAEERSTTDSIDEVLAWMTRFDTLPAIDLPDVDPDVRLRVRVESTLGRRFMMYMIPLRRTVSAEKRLEP